MRRTAPTMFALVTAVLGLTVSGCTSSPSATPDTGSPGDQTASSPSTSTSTPKPQPQPQPSTSAAGSSARTPSPTASSAARIVIRTWDLTFTSLAGIPKEDLVVNSYADDPDTVTLGSKKLRSEANRSKCSGQDIEVGGFVTVFRSTSPKAKEPANEVKIGNHYYGVYPALADKVCYPEADYQTYFDDAVAKQVRQTLARR